MARTKCTGKRVHGTANGLRKQVVFTSDCLVKRRPIDGGVCVCSLSDDKTGQGDCPYCRRHKRAKRREIYKIMLELATEETELHGQQCADSSRVEVIDLTKEAEEVSRLKKRNRGGRDTK